MASFAELAANEPFTADKNVYEHPLVQRYASKEMSYVWSPVKKFRTWRLMWIALATAEQELGLDVTTEQIEEMKAQIDNIDWEYAEQKEAEFRHDVMGHVHAFGKVCPKAMPIIHLGATSCYVGDNTDIVQIRDALLLVRRKLVKLLAVMAAFADKHKELATLGFTHYQPAQLTTVGKRCTLWMQDLVLDVAAVSTGTACAHRPLPKSWRLTSLATALPKQRAVPAVMRDMHIAPRQLHFKWPRLESSRFCWVTHPMSA
eukprot:TRINITY_DN1862_c0_g1_i2.p1 TRINITY_DN1862_c0_g1~~TRINITY_DN1862_c0_g1_i2.p1  ORF type:complete len:259 (-),score=57.04 TRINITY_DN1862_c0_g1_i2:171-947(-)